MPGPGTWAEESPACRIGTVWHPLFLKDDEMSTLSQSGMEPRLKYQNSLLIGVLLAAVSLALGKQCRAVSRVCAAANGLAAQRLKAQLI